MSDDSDWSDSDVENSDEMETNVLLGVPDGLITIPSDLTDVAVSRIGGHPAFLSVKEEPPYESCECRSCKEKMKLLIQMWCPFEDSPMDRALYVWGCARKGCQGKSGSVRAWRGLRYNDVYAAKLAKKKEKEAREKAKKKAEEPKPKPTGNPFSTSLSATKIPFGLGDQIFGDANKTSSPEQPVTDDTDVDDDGASDAESVSSAESLITALASARLSASPWLTSPSYPPLYLSTACEYAPHQPSSSKDLSNTESDAAKLDKESWTSEVYENSMNMDQIFEHFTRRVAWEGEQCVRYELHGTPLPFSSDHIFQSLFPISPNTNKRQFASSVSDLVPKCEICEGERIFECQLMPNLINILSKHDSTTLSDSDQDNQARVDKVKNSEGMEWGTCFIFSCAKDCSLADNREDFKGCWREEIVLIQKDE